MKKLGGTEGTRDRGRGDEGQKFKGTKNSSAQETNDVPNWANESDPENF